MKRCSDCNIEMIENVKISGQHPFEVGVDGRSDIYVHIPTGEKGSFLGIKYDQEAREKLLARMCPNCGKIELYVNIKKN